MATRRDAQAQEDAATSKTSQTTTHQPSVSEGPQTSIRPSSSGGLPRHARATDVLSLQRTLGNRAVQRMIQRKVTNPGSVVAPPAQQTTLSADVQDAISEAVSNALQQPAKLNALAYAQGSGIHVAPGQEQHLPHEAWHVAQQKQGRVKSTMQLEREDEQ